MIALTNAFPAWLTPPAKKKKKYTQNALTVNHFQSSQIKQAYAPLSLSLFLFVAQQPNAGQERPMLDVCRSHTLKHHGRWDFSGRGIGPSQRHLITLEYKISLAL